MEKLAHNIIGLVATGLLVTHFVYDVPGDWFLIAAVTQIAAWSLDPRWWTRRTPAGRAVQDYRKYLISTLTLWPPCLLLGWIIDRVAQTQGWLTIAWLGLCLVGIVYGAFRRWHSATIVSDKGE